MMLPFKRILCPTDFSEPSYEAIRAAAELALYFQAELTLIHVIPVVPVMATPVEGAGVGAPPANAPEFTREMKRNAEKVLSEEAHERVPQEVKLHLIVTRGEPAQSVLDAAEEIGADTIVISTHGRTGWRRFIFGSVAEKVVRCATCPVLTIHERQDTGTDFESRANETVEA